MSFRVEGYGFVNSMCFMFVSALVAVDFAFR